MAAQYEEIALIGSRILRRELHVRCVADVLCVTARLCSDGEQPRNNHRADTAMIFVSAPREQCQIKLYPGRPMLWLGFSAFDITATEVRQLQLKFGLPAFRGIRAPHLSLVRTPK